MVHYGCNRSTGARTPGLGVPAPTDGGSAGRLSDDFGPTQRSEDERRSKGGLRMESGRLGRLATFTARHRWPVIGAWLVLTVIGGVAAGKLSSRWYQSFS